MAENIEVSSSFKDFCQFLQDFLAPELRGIKVTLEAHGAAIAELRTDIREVRVEVKELRAEMKADNAELRAEVKKGFERLDRRMETYEDVQHLKEEMAEIRGERRARKTEPAA